MPVGYDGRKLSIEDTMGQSWCEYCGEEKAVAGDVACRDCRKAIEQEEKRRGDEA